MSRFCSQKTITYKFDEKDDNSEFIEFYASLPFSKIKEIILLIDKDDELKNIEIFIPLLRMGIKNWSMKNDDNDPVNYSVDKVGELDANTVIELANWYMPKIMPDQKKTTT